MPFGVEFVKHDGEIIPPLWLYTTRQLAEEQLAIIIRDQQVRRCQGKYSTPRIIEREARGLRVCYALPHPKPGGTG